MQEKKTYTFEEAYEATLNYFDGDALAARVCDDRRPDPDDCRQEQPA